MRIEVDASDFKRLAAQLSDFSERRLNAAIATGLTRTAVQGRDAVRQQMTQVFDRPTPWVLNSLWVETATAQRNQVGPLFIPSATNNIDTRMVSSSYLAARVYAKDNLAGGGAANYLRPHIGGGSRVQKRLEQSLRASGALPAGWYAVPAAGARLDAYGNIARGQIIEILSQLRITMVSGFNRNMSFNARSAISAQRRAGGRFFVVRPGAKSQPGVYQREFMGKSMSPVLLFWPSVKYRPRLSFFSTVEQTAKARLGGNIEQALAEQAARLAGRRAGQA